METLEEYFSKRKEKEMRLLETDNEEVYEHVYKADVAAHAVGSVVFEKEDVTKHRKEAYEHYMRAIELEPENPHLWFRFVWFFQFMRSEYEDKLKYESEYQHALIKVIELSKNTKYYRTYDHTMSDARVCAYALEKDFGLVYTVEPRLLCKNVFIEWLREFEIPKYEEDWELKPDGGETVRRLVGFEQPECIKEILKEIDSGKFDWLDKNGVKIDSKGNRI